MNEIEKIEYPICPYCLQQTVAGACLESGRSLYCVNPKCRYDVSFEDLTTPVKK